MTNRRTRLIIGFLCLVAIVGEAWWWYNKPAPNQQPVSLGTPIQVSLARPQINGAATAKASPSLDADLSAAAARMRAGSGSQKQTLDDLRQRLASMSASETSIALRNFLDSKTDAPTGRGFKIGKNGVLDDAPTLRTFLLDYLGQIDPAAAAAYARVILDSSDSSDEWAVALRNLARGDATTEGRKLLEEKTAQLLRNESWQQNPSVGYLEAFDAAVYLGGTNLVSPLADLVRKQDNPAIAHAAYLSLDRLVINEPAELLNTLNSKPDLMQGREQTRANYFARADVRSPEQKQTIEAYLLNPRIGAAELDQFAGLYPNANFMISPNLLTPTPTPARGDLVSRDAESLRVLNEWLADERFAKARPQLEKAKARLEEFVRQAAGK